MLTCTETKGLMGIFKFPRGPFTETRPAVDEIVHAGGNFKIREPMCDDMMI